MQSGEWERALALLNEAVPAAVASGNVGPTVLFGVYKWCMHILRLAGRYQEALQVLEDMKANGVRPGTFCMTCAIHACEKASVSVFQSVREGKGGRSVWYTLREVDPTTLSCTQLSSGTAHFLKGGRSPAHTALSDRWAHGRHHQCA